MDYNFENSVSLQYLGPQKIFSVYEINNTVGITLRCHHNKSHTVLRHSTKPCHSK